MDIIVQKYGGTSVGSAERIKAVAKRIVKDRKKFAGLVVVVSAMGKTTDELISLAGQVSENPSPREYDALISNGENISASLLAMAIHSLGENVISLTGAQAGIKTENIYSKAKITNVDTTRIDKELRDGKIVVVTGFQGINDYYDVTTIGRGGSDTSAVVLAAALNARECEIYTDVDGVYTTDPRDCSEARKLDEISYEEMLELASLGAKVLHPRSVECAKENKLTMHVRSSFKNDDGTRVKEINKMETKKAVTGIAKSDNEVMISILNVPDDPGIAGAVFEELAKENINIDMIVQSTERGGVNNITFTVNGEDRDKAEEVTRKAADKIGVEGVECKDSIAKVSIVGVGMISRPGIAARFFRVLGQNGINIKLITTSEIKISCAINKEEADIAVGILHKEFELETN
ncbi:MAG: aspartate kinase [bacterium]|nr:aspartate kinase [bacterium]